MRRIIVAALVAVPLLPFAPSAQAIVCPKPCVLSGSDTGSGIMDPYSFHLETIGTAVEHRGRRLTVPTVLEYALVADITFKEGAVRLGRGTIKIFDLPSRREPRYTFEVEAVGSPSIATTTQGSVGEDWVFYTASTKSLLTLVGTWKNVSGNSYAGALSFAAL